LIKCLGNTMEKLRLEVVCIRRNSRSASSSAAVVAMLTLKLCFNILV
jgi:hypothetical protein